MKRHDDVWPANINTASKLSIDTDCLVTDVYNLICDRPNIKQIRVCIAEYTPQEIRNLPIDKRLGRPDHESRIIFTEADQITPADGYTTEAITATEMPRHQWIVPEQLLPNTGHQAGTAPAQGVITDEIRRHVEEELERMAAVQTAVRPTLAQLNALHDIQTGTAGQWIIDGQEEDVY